MLGHRQDDPAEPGRPRLLGGDASEVVGRRVRPATMVASAAEGRDRDEQGRQGRSRSYLRRQRRSGRRQRDQAPGPGAPRLPEPIDDDADRHRDRRRHQRRDPPRAGGRSPRRPSGPVIEVGMQRFGFRRRRPPLRGFGARERDRSAGLAFETLERAPDEVEDLPGQPEGRRDLVVLGVLVILLAFLEMLVVLVVLVVS